MLCQQLATEYLVWGPDGAPRSPKSIEGHQQLPILGGLTKTAEVTNRRLNRGLAKMTDVSSPNTKSKIQTRRSFLLQGGEPVLGDADIIGPEEFDQNLSGVQTSITALKIAHDTFSPGNAQFQANSGAKSSAPGNSRSRGSGEDAEDDEAQAWLEKLDKYRYVRKIEPEIPPLDRTKTFVPRPVDTSIVKLNMSPEKLKIFRQSTQLRLREERRDASEKRFQENRERFYDELMEREMRCTIGFSRKFKGGSRRISQLDIVAETKAEQELEAVRMWLGMVVQAAFLEGLQESIKFHKMPTSELMKFGADVGQPSTTRRLSGQKCGALVMRAIQMNQLFSNKDSWRKFSLIAAVFQSKIRVRRKKRLAARLWQAMFTWKVGGKFIMSMKQFHQKMRKLQHWWRAQRVKINRMKDKLIKRWIHLERKILFQEFAVAPPPGESAGYVAKRRDSRGQPLPAMKASLSIEERINIALMDEKVRRNFVGAELRARRYFHLPKVAVWLEDIKKYWIEVAKWRETKNAASAMMNKEEALKIAGAMPWPPACPSYFPTEDQEILEMVKRARQNADNVTLIPTKNNMSKMEQQKKGTGEDDESGLEKNINDEEMKRWGIDLEAMPGLGKGSFQPGLAKKESKEKGRNSFFFLLHSSKAN